MCLKDGDTMICICLFPFWIYSERYLFWWHVLMVFNFWRFTIQFWYITQFFMSCFLSCWLSSGYYISRNFDNFTAFDIRLCAQFEHYFEWHFLPFWKMFKWLVWSDPLVISICIGYRIFGYFYELCLWVLSWMIWIYEGMKWST